MTSLLDQLPSVRGSYTPNTPLGETVWFRVGGAAEILFKPKDEDDLGFFLRHKPAHVPVTILGAGSNVLIRDGGIPGVVIKLGKAFASIVFEGTTLRVGAGALDRTVALTAAQKGVGGFSFLSGIPGTIGGAIKMNAGAYGREVKDGFVSCRVMTLEGQVETRYPDSIQFTHRTSTIKDQEIVLEAVFEGTNASSDALHQEIEEIMRQREQSQPVRARTGGSTFKNPPHAKAWELIDAAGYRGKELGGAMVSEKHCNFLINTGTATAHDLELLGENIQKDVLSRTGILLEWEIRRLGVMKKE
jgi:UDP-N-acetylmuramate dehydrogenase